MISRNWIEGRSGKVDRAGWVSLPCLAATVCLALLAGYGLESGRQAYGQGFGMPAMRSMPSPSRSFTPSPSRSFTPSPSRSFTPSTPRSFTPSTPRYHQQMERAVNRFTDQSLQRTSQMQQQATMRYEQQRARDQSRRHAAQNHAVEAAAREARAQHYNPYMIRESWIEEMPRHVRGTWQQPQPAAPLIQVGAGDTVVTTAWAPLKRGTRTLLTVEAHTELHVTGVRGNWAGLHVWQNGQRYSGWIHARYLGLAGEG